MANLKKSEIESLLTEVEDALTAALKEEQEKLSKAFPPEESSDDSAPAKEPEASTSSPDGDGDSDASATPPPSDDASASASPDAPPMPPAGAAVPADGSPSPDQPADPAADVSNDPQALQDEYSKLGASDPEALKNHYLACKAALFALMGAGADASATPPAPAAAPPMPPAPAASAPPPAMSPSAPPAMKSEMATGGMPKTTEEANGGKGMMKSEKDQIKGLTEKLAKQEEAMAGLLSVVTSVFETPVRKAVTSIAHLEKTEETKENDLSNLPKAEIKARLRKAAEKPLSKSDRSLITGFDLGHVSVEKIAHLIK